MFHRLRGSLSSRNLAVISSMGLTVDYIHWECCIVAVRAFLTISIHLSCLYSLYMVPPFGPSAMLSRLRRFGSMSSLCGVILARVWNQSGTIDCFQSPPFR